jgi:sulfur carrier protein
MLKVTVNGKDTELEKDYTIQELLEVLKVEMAQYVTVQLNDKILLREDFDTLRVADGDAIEFLYFMGGGAV